MEFKSPPELTVCNFFRRGLSIWEQLTGRGAVLSVPLPQNVVLFGFLHKCLNILPPTRPYIIKYSDGQKYLPTPTKCVFWLILINNPKV